MLYKLSQCLRVVVLYSILFISFGAVLEVTHPPAPVTTSAASVPTDVSRASVSAMPKRLTIPRLGMSLDIIPGTYDPASKTWTLTETAVQFAAMTSLPNDRSGTMLLYGHNTAKVLAPTDHLVEGDIATVTTQDGKVYTYAFSNGRLVDPSDTSVLRDDSTPPKLSLLTCDGLWDEKRRVMTFDFVSAQ